MGGSGSGRYGGRPPRRAAAAWTSIGCTGKAACDRVGRARFAGPAMARRWGPSACERPKGGSRSPIATDGATRNGRTSRSRSRSSGRRAPSGARAHGSSVPGVMNGVPCGRRVGKLYGPGRYFLCRHCYGLAYQSQREQPHERALRRANGIRMRLGGEPGILCPFPEKPKGMHWRTYERLWQRVRDAEMMAEERLWVQLARIKARLGRQKRQPGA